MAVGCKDGRSRRAAAPRLQPVACRSQLSFYPRVPSKSRSRCRSGLIVCHFGRRRVQILNMRQKRAKAYRRLMSLYTMSFGFRQPYQVLVDSEMCKTAAESKTELAKQLSSVLQGDVKPSMPLPSVLKCPLRSPGKPSDHPVLHPRALPAGQIAAARGRSRKDVRAAEM